MEPTKRQNALERLQTNLKNLEEYQQEMQTQVDKFKNMKFKPGQIAYHKLKETA